MKLYVYDRVAYRSEMEFFRTERVAVIENCEIVDVPDGFNGKELWCVRDMDGEPSFLITTAVEEAFAALRTRNGKEMYAINVRRAPLRVEVDENEILRVAMYRRAPDEPKFSLGGDYSPPEPPRAKEDVAPYPARPAEPETLFQMRRLDEPKRARRRSWSWVGFAGGVLAGVGASMLFNSFF